MTAATGGARHGANAPRAPKSERPRERPPWTWRELETVWRHPDMTAEEVAEMLPGRTPKAVSRIRDRYGRWRTEGVVPLCQRCGEHPVFVEDPEARRWGLCRECAQAEKDWRDRNGDRLARENAARRQRKHKRRGRK